MLSNDLLCAVSGTVPYLEGLFHPALPSHSPRSSNSSKMENTDIKSRSIDMTQIEKIEVAEPPDQTIAFTTMETRRLLRKLDIAILPLVSTMYLLSFLDRSNIGNARLAGLEQDLGMTGWDYAVSELHYPSMVLQFKELTHTHAKR